MSSYYEPASRVLEAGRKVAGTYFELVRYAGEGGMLFSLIRITKDPGKRLAARHISHLKIHTETMNDRGKTFELLGFYIVSKKEVERDNLRISTSRK